MPHRKHYFSVKTLFLISRFLLRRLKSSKTSPSGGANAAVSRAHHGRHASSLPGETDLRGGAVVFDVEEALLRSASPFPYFMLVAFEAGSLMRSVVLLLLYPLICLVGPEAGLGIMVFVSFFGVRKKTFRVGSAVLPKFFLEDVGLEGYEVLRAARRRVAVTRLPLVMVESFLRDYLEIERVVGRELAVVCGYFVGFMVNREQEQEQEDSNKYEEEHKIGIRGFETSSDHQLFSSCKEIYLVRESDKRKWRSLPSDKYPKKLIFHDGRLALTPTPLAALATFMWVPLGVALAVARIIVSKTFPYNISSPILAFSGLHLIVTKPKPPTTTTTSAKTKGILYVCNHRTLLDPLYLCSSLGKDLTAVTYSLSRLSEILAPIRTVRLTRNREADGRMMERLLGQGDLVVCPEGTTCREPYLLRFSPLFAEMSESVVPVAMDTRVEMFHGTTASGFKGLDPVFFLMNPTPSYAVRLLDPVSTSTCRDRSGGWRFDVANEVQGKLGEALGFQCTALTRRDKYLTLAGNEGSVTDCSDKTK